MPEFIPLISEQDIQDQIQKTGQRISLDYQTKDLVLVGILKGSFIFLADLSRKITIDHEIDLIGASSYVLHRQSGVYQKTGSEPGKPGRPTCGRYRRHRPDPYQNH